MELLAFPPQPPQHKPQGTDRTIQLIRRHIILVVQQLPVQVASSKQQQRVRAPLLQALATPLLHALATPIQHDFIMLIILRLNNYIFAPKNLLFAFKFSGDDS